jgi:hypothetical protein
MKKYLLIFGCLLLLGAVVILVNVVKAENTASTGSSNVLPIVKDILSTDLRQSLTISEIRGRIICKELGTCSSAAQTGTIEVLMKAAKVTEINNNVLKVSIFNYNYQIDTNSANLVRYLWGQSNISEFSVGDIVNVWGYLDETDTSLVHARNIRDVSIQKLYGVFNGVIDSLDSANNSFVLKTESRGNQTVLVSADTKIVKATTTIAFGDLQTDMGVVVRGVWNKTSSQIQAQVINIPGSNEARPQLKENFLQQLKDKLKIKF